MESLVTLTSYSPYTRAADGMGLAIAHALAARGGWRIHILDTKDDAAGRKAVALLGGEAHAVFHRVDIRDYEQLAAAFRNVFLEGGRRQLDVVFANAGVFEKTIHYEIKSEDGNEPPSPLPLFFLLLLTHPYFFYRVVYEGA